MNKKVLDIATAAGITVWVSGIGRTPTHFDGRVDSLENFAKLIMEECISACASDKLGKTMSAEELIKQHLGMVI